MSLSANVVPGVLARLAALCPPGAQVPAEVASGASGAVSAPLRGISYGTRLSVPISPWAWVQNSSFSVENPMGASLTSTPWVMLIRLVHKYAPDTVNAERRLAALIDPIRLAYERNTMLQPEGSPTVRESYVSSGDWGFMEVNGVWYRFLDLNVTVTEKEVRTYS